MAKPLPLPVRDRAEPGRGRSASTPSEVPVRGWKDILLRIWKNIGKDRVVVLAAGVTFYSILALFPAIAALVALYGLFADPNTIAGHVDSLSGILPEGAVQIVGDEMKRIAAQGNNKLGITFIVGLATALWSANAGVFRGTEPRQQRAREERIDKAECSLAGLHPGRDCLHAFGFGRDGRASDCFELFGHCRCSR